MYQVSVYEDSYRIETKKIRTTEKYIGICYSFYDNKGYGKFAVGKTKEEAISIILNSYQNEIRRAKETILNCEDRINLVLSYNNNNKK